MDIKLATEDTKCDMGSCKNQATHTIQVCRVGIRAQFHACEKCLKELRDALSKMLEGEEL